MHDVQQDKEPCRMEHKSNHMGFDFVNIRYLSFDNEMSVIFTKLRVKH